MSAIHNMPPEAQTAIIIERLDRMAEDMREHRNQTESEIKEVREVVNNMDVKLEQQSDTLKVYRAFHVVIVALSAVGAYAFDIFGKAAALFIR